MIRRTRALIVCGIILAMSMLMAACEGNSDENVPNIADISIPVTNEFEDGSLDISASKDSGVQEENASTSDVEITKESKPAEKSTDSAVVSDDGNKSLAITPDASQTAQSSVIQQPETTTNTQAATSSYSSSYEQIYNEYSQKLADYYSTAKSELQSEASSGKSIDALATSCSNKVSRLAEISTEGVNKMADLCVKRGGSSSEYMNYGTKLESVYMDYGTKLESVYMSGAMNSQTKAVEDTMKDLGISSDISGQYSEEMNKAMDQYNNELNKAMDDYNQQVQDMLKQYGL